MNIPALELKLAQLHYSLPFTVDSAALVEKLLSDLLTFKSLNDSLSQKLYASELQLSKDQQSLAPLRAENERVVRENNQLHVEIIEAKEARERCEIEWREKLRKVEAEMEDVR